MTQKIKGKGTHWCAACGEYGDHSSGTCKTIDHLMTQKMTSEERFVEFCKPCGTHNFNETTHNAWNAQGAHYTKLREVAEAQKSLIDDIKERLQKQASNRRLMQVAQPAREILNLIKFNEEQALQRWHELQKL